MKKIITASGLLLTFLASCSVQKPQPVAYQNIADLIDHSPVLKQHHVGFSLKEVNATQTMFQKNADKYFIPASNIKLFTFYTALNMLGDSIPSITYVIKNDSLLVWPMADASFLHPKFTSQKAFNFIKRSGKDIYLISGRYKGQKFGKGWAWDNFNDRFQAEISEFPLYGNVVNISNDGAGKLKYQPDLSSMYLSDLSVSKQQTMVKRGIGDNNLTIPNRVSTDFKQTVPLHLDKNTLENLFSDTLLATGMVLKPVSILAFRNVPTNAKIIYSVKADSLYKEMLQQSDNFMGEEILLNCAAANHLTMRTDSVISVATKNLLSDLPDKMQWVDGSGLSRENLTTPRDITTLLQKIYTKVNNEKRLFDLLANGGKSGTLKNMFKTSDEPFVFAKSGTLSNNYNLSGYLLGVSGKKYVFSFMNNNYLLPTATVMAEVEKILTFIHNNY